MLSSAASHDAEESLDPVMKSDNWTGDKMFVIESRDDKEGRVIVVGKSSRKHATSLINIPISQKLKSCLDDRVVGSLSMATAALLQWAFDELERQKISLEARPQR